MRSPTGVSVSCVAAALLLLAVVATHAASAFVLAGEPMLEPLPDLGQDDDNGNDEELGVRRVPPAIVLQTPNDKLYIPLPCESRLCRYPLHCLSQVKGATERNYNAARCRIFTLIDEEALIRVQNYLLALVIGNLKKCWDYYCYSCENAVACLDFP